MQLLILAVHDENLRVVLTYLLTADLDLLLSEPLSGHRRRQTFCSQPTQFNDTCIARANSSPSIALAGTKIVPSILASEVLALGAGTVDGIFEGVRSIASSLNLQSEGENLIATTRSRIGAVTDAVRDKPKPTVVMLEWTDPIFSMGNWGPELVEAANGQVLLGEKGQFSRAISWKEVRDADPEFLIIAPCGYDIARTIRELRLLEALPGWSHLKSVRAGTVAVAYGNLYFNRSGTTIVETVEILAEILHGYRSADRRHAAAWQPYADVALGGNAL